MPASSPGQLDADSTSILRVLQSKKLAEEVGFDSLTLFSMFIPDTYEVYWTIRPEELVRRMKREYDRFWTPERDAARQRSGLSRLEVMTLASIVYEETRQTGRDAPHRRGLHQPPAPGHSRSQARSDGEIRDAEFRSAPHPAQAPEIPVALQYLYNRGLPPSPICMPGKNAIDAVLHFEEHDYLFFCARPTFDGYHNFARTLREHNANARAYSAELNRRKIK